MDKTFAAQGIFIAFEKANLPVTMFMVSVETKNGEVACFFNEESGVTSLPFQRGQPVIISGKIAMPVDGTIMLSHDCSVTGVT